MEELRKEDGTRAQSSKEKAETLNQFFSVEYSLLRIEASHSLILDLKEGL